MKSATLRTSLLLLCSFGMAFSASGQSLSEIDSDAASVLVDRGSVDLQADLEDATHRDADVANTALVFTNARKSRAGVWCRAFDSNGNPVGRADAVIPGNGLRYIRASDLSGGADFVGSVTCWSRGRVEASVVFLGPSAITDLKTLQHHLRGGTVMRFPVVASY